MTGRYPAGHGARHNGMRLDLKTPTLADTLSQAGFATGAFVAAFPLDRRFGLIKGFQTYGDRMPPSRTDARSTSDPAARSWTRRSHGWRDIGADAFFLWVHLFEPHAPYGDPADPTPLDRGAVRRRGRGGGPAGGPASSTRSGPQRRPRWSSSPRDHGEAFGEHGEIGHSIFVYDTTLRVPLILSGAGHAARATRSTTRWRSSTSRRPSCALLGVAPFDADGIDLSARVARRAARRRASSTPSRSRRCSTSAGARCRRCARGGWKYIDAPKPELLRRSDPRIPAKRAISAAARGGRASPKSHARIVAAIADRRTAAIDPKRAARLQALG